MINKETISEKLKYLILMNAKSSQFEILNLFIEIEFNNQDHTEIANYDIDVKFDYQGSLEFDIYEFAHDIQRMSEKLRDILSEYVISKDGKIVNGNNSNYFMTEPSIYNIDYEIDSKHIFNLGYKFHYHDD
jgi:hypothetical protein